MDLYLISRLPRQWLDAFVRQLESEGTRWIGSHYRLSVRAVLETEPFITVVTLARNEHNPLPEMFFDKGPLLYVLSGYVVDDLERTGLRHYFGRTTAEERPVVRSPGGIYSYATVRRSDGQVCAGQSVPTLEPVYYSARYLSLHVGNHPLLVHMAGQRFEGPVIREPFFFSAAPATVALDDTTPYQGCYRAPPRSILVNRPGTCIVEVRPTPQPHYGHYRTTTLKRRVAAVTEALVEAGSILRRLPEPELRLSGGKDSRLLAAYLIREGIAAVPVNQNLAWEVEGQVADRVARELGADECFRVPIETVLRRDHIEHGTIRKIAYTGGLPSTAALQYPNRHAGIRPGAPVVMGHAHLQRGGLPNRIRRPQEAMAVAASRTASPYLKPGYVESNLRLVGAFVDQALQVTDLPAQRIAFLVYLQYSVNYQLQSLYTYMRNWHHLVTPFVDERFTSLCEQIANSPAVSRPGELSGIMDLRGERIAMETLKSLAPSLLDFPLASDRFLCDTPGTPGYERRDPALIVPGAPAPEETRNFNTRKTDTPTRIELWKTIDGSVVGRFAEQSCLPTIWEYVSVPGTAVPADVNRAALNQFLWSLYGLSLILDSPWWEGLRGANGRWAVVDLNH